MKAVVISHRPNGTYVLDRAGSFRLIKGLAGKPIGAEVNVRSSEAMRWRYATVITYCLAVVLFFAGFAGLWSAKSYTMYVDINPSIELEFNCFDQLIAVHGLNPEAEALLQELKLHGSPGEVVFSLLQTADAEGYLNKVGSIPPVLVTVVAKSEEASYSHMYVISQFMDKNGLGDIANISTCSPELLERAQSLGISPGKLSLVEHLLDVDPSIPINDIIDLPVSELMGELQAAEERAGQPDGSTTPPGPLPGQQEGEGLAPIEPEAVPGSGSDGGSGGSGSGGGRTQ